VVIFGAIAAGCASTPKSTAKRTKLEDEAMGAKQAMLAKNPSLQTLLDQSAGYIVFPEVKEGGFIVGGAGAQGVLYENGRPTGFATLSRAAVGAIAGGQKYAELVAIRDPYQLQKFKSGEMDMGAQASAVILRAGAATSTTFGDNGMAVLIDPIGGAMVNASLSGQKIRTTRM
jgi:lipid-binding SYLF domain-containing protein